MTLTLAIAAVAALDVLVLALVACAMSLAAKLRPRVTRAEQAAAERRALERQFRRPSTVATARRQVAGA